MTFAGVMVVSLNRLSMCFTIAEYSSTRIHSLELFFVDTLILNWFLMMKGSIRIEIGSHSSLTASFRSNGNVEITIF